MKRGGGGRKNGEASKKKGNKERWRGLVGGWMMT